MKSNLLAISITLTSALLCSSALAGNATTEGYYYKAQQYISTGIYYYSQVGAFSTSDDCNLARNADFGDGGAIPSASGPGCFYLYANDIANYNDLFDHYNSVAGTSGNGITNHEEYYELLQNVGGLGEHHSLKEYRRSMTKLTTQQRR
jgi:hypothetical protein